MKISQLAVLVLVMLCLFAGCGKEPVQPVVATTPPTTIQPTTEPTEPPDIVYEDAVRDYLLPVEEFSWERKYKPECVLLHFTSAVMLDRNDPYNLDLIRQTFIDYDLSIHYIVDRDGTVYCYIPENVVSWHAGEGTWKNDEKYTNKLNYYAIGIEIVAMGSQADMAQYLTASEYYALDQDLMGYTDAQYESLRALVADICNRYDIPQTREYVLGHQDYSPTKNDPGELFDWSRILP